MFVCRAQNAVVVPAPPAAMPAHTVDGNSPGIWVNGLLQVYTSTGGELQMMTGESVETLAVAAGPTVSENTHMPMWIEALWRDADGTIYGWYHHEKPGVCGGSLTTPEIGALVSTDGGRHFVDLGIVLASGAAPNCAARNGFFAGGHGDFSVILDREHRYFYFLFTNYSGPAGQQGVAMARMAFEDRAHPAGAVFKLSGGRWEQPGLGGTVTPIFAATVPWERENTDSFWGPAIHWNSEIERYVVLMNRACCQPEWPQEGIYAAFSADLADPAAWIGPKKIMDAAKIGFAPGYYPQVWGTTDTEAGQLPRLFIKGVSNWRLYFGYGDFVEPDGPGPDDDEEELGPKRR